MCGALDDLGVDSSKLRVVLMQMVRLISGGEVVKMSKRSGKAITLSTLTQEVPIEAARFFFNLNSPDVGIDFDMDLAVSQTKENPVYYVCYAHARICSIIKGLGLDVRRCMAEEISLLVTDYERELIKQLAQFTNVITDCARAYDTSGLTRYLIDLSSLFHKFYGECRIKGESEPLASARLLLCHAAARVLRTGLGVLKIEAPESM
jgi:arginyl-tRNA synthetase